VKAWGGVVAAYVHNSVAPGLGGIGVLVAVVTAAGGAPLAQGSPAAAAAFDLGKRLAMHVAAFNPKYLSRQSIPPAVLAAERAIHEAQVRGCSLQEEVLLGWVLGRVQ
jgi:elongation factor Ts